MQIEVKIEDTEDAIDAALLDTGLNARSIELLNHYKSMMLASDNSKVMLDLESYTTLEPYWTFS